MNFGSELKKFLYVTNIPAPYRIELHNVMFREMKKNGIYFEVAFMSRTEKIRNWDVDSMLRKAKFPFKIYRDYKINIYRSIKDIQINHPKEFHFNPEIITNTIRNKWDFVLIGGWDNLTTIILSFIPKSIIKSIKVMRPESNKYSIRKKTGIIGLMRKKILQQANIYAVPGLRTIELLRDIMPAKPPGSYMIQWRLWVTVQTDFRKLSTAMNEE